MTPQRRTPYGLDDYWILDGHEPVPATQDEYYAWRNANEHGDVGPRRVAETTLTDGTWISTIFYGRDMNPNPEGPVLLF